MTMQWYSSQVLNTIEMAMQMTIHADVNCIVSDKAKMVKDEHGCDTVVDFDQLTTLVKQ